MQGHDVGQMHVQCPCRRAPTAVHALHHVWMVHIGYNCRVVLKGMHPSGPTYAPRLWHDSAAVGRDKPQ